MGDAKVVRFQGVFLYDSIAYVSIRIRQYTHTSAYAYVSIRIRQHTSAYEKFGY
jgi:hypothetical protein